MHCFKTRFKVSRNEKRVETFRNIEISDLQRMIYNATSDLAYNFLVERALKGDHLNRYPATTLFSGYIA